MVTYTFTNGTTADADEVNQNFKDVQKNIPQIPFTTLKSTGTWTNEGNLAADRVTVAAGVNGTINTGSTTAVFGTNFKLYFLSLNDITNFSDATLYGVTHSNTIELIHSYDITDSLVDDVSVDVRAAYIDNSGNGHFYLVFTYSDATTASTPNQTQGSAYASKSFTNPNREKVVTSIAVYCNGDNYQFNSNCKNFVADLKEFNSASTVVCDTGTLTLSGNENVISIYNPSSIPTNTSIKVTLNDGTKDISADTTLSENDTTIIPLTVTPTADATLELHYSLETTDTSVTPEWYGYGVSKL